MRIGYACVPMTIDARTTRTFRLNGLTEDKLIATARENIEDLKRILICNTIKEISMFRISSDIIPFGSHDSNCFDWVKPLENILKETGNLIKENNIRVSMHPGQYTVINSENGETVRKSIKDVEYHASFLKALGVDYSHKIVLHIGGVYGDKYKAKMNFVNNFKRLSDEAKSRVILENDDRSYNICDVLEVCSETGSPAVFDNLHNEYNPCDLAIEAVMDKVSKTWGEKDGKIKLHYSDGDYEKRKGAHSKTVNVINFLKYAESVKGYDPDIMLEVKDKDISAEKCINVLNYNTKTSRICEVWAKYKYLVMEKNYSYYKRCSACVKEGCTMTELYSMIDEFLQEEGSEDAYINTLQHVWGYFKKSATEAEKKRFFKLLEEKAFQKAKAYLRRLAEKYNEEYLLRSFYFVQ